MRHRMQLRSVNPVSVITETTPPDRTIGGQWTHDDALLEARDLVGMLGWVNTQR